MLRKTLAVTAGAPDRLSGGRAGGAGGLCGRLRAADHAARAIRSRCCAEFDWSLLVFFCGLFVLSGVLETNGVTAAAVRFLRVDGGAGVWGLTAVSTALSNLVSNVPAVLLLKPVVAAWPTPTAGWLTLAMASTLAGNLTLLGSVANLIVAESAAGKGVHLGFWAYTRAGLLITALSLALGGLWLQWVVWG